MTDDQGQVPRPHVILVAEDDETVRRLFAFTLESAGLTVLEAADGDGALEVLREHDVDVVLLDRSMPGRDGPATLEAIRSDPRMAATSVIFVTGSVDLDHRLQGLDAGADDYLQKPINPVELLARVRAHLRGRDAWRRVLSQRLHVRTTVAQSLGRIPTDCRPAQCAAAICERLDRLGPAASSAVVAMDDAGAELLAGTGSLGGHPGPRRLPRHLAARLHEQARQGPWVEQRGAQPAGAGSVPLADADVTAAAYVPLTADERVIGLLALCDGPSGRDGDAAGCLSAGIDLAPLVAALLRPLLDNGARDETRRSRMVHRIESAAFAPAFQPIVDLTSARVVGFEALTRFRDGAEPERVFGEAAALGLGPDLEAATAAAALSAASALPDEAWLSLNISPGFITDTERLTDVLTAPPCSIVLELTEHDPVDDYAKVLTSVAALERPTRLSVDDAGAGYACLHHVLELRPAFIKLDRGWVHGIAEDPAKQALVAGLGNFADRAEGRLIAEGIEEPEELAVLTDLGVPLGQGWLLGRPADAAGRRV